jgi:hypothetical protein
VKEVNEFLAESQARGRIRYYWPKTRGLTEKWFSWGKTQELELFGQSGLFQNSIGGMPRFDRSVDHELDPSFRAEPDFMIPFTRTIEITPRFPKYLL